MKKVIALFLALSSACAFGLTKEEALIEATTRIETLNTAIDQNPIEYFNGFDLFLDPEGFISDKKNINFIFRQSFLCFQLIDWTIINNCLQNPDATVADAQREIAQSHTNIERLVKIKHESNALTQETINALCSMPSQEILEYVMKDRQSAGSNIDHINKEFSRHINMEEASYLDFFANKNFLNSLIDNSLLLFQCVDSAIINSCLFDSDLSLGKSCNILNGMNYILQVILEGKKQSDILTQSVLEKI